MKAKNPKSHFNVKTENINISNDDYNPKKQFTVSVAKQVVSKYGEGGLDAVLMHRVMTIHAR